MALIRPQRACVWVAVLWGVLVAVLWAVSAAAQDAAVSFDTPPPAAEAIQPEAASEAEIRQAFRRMKREDGIQWTLETRLPDPPQPPPRWIQAIGDAVSAVIEFLLPVLRILFWAGVGALALVVAWVIYTALRGIVLERANADDPDGPAEYAPSARAARLLLEDADALAERGEYAAAIRLILLRSIQDIARTRPEAVRLSLTAREIGASALLGERTRLTFAQIAALVERGHFAGRTVSAQDYRDARALYADFVQATPQQPAAPEGSVGEGVLA